MKSPDWNVFQTFDLTRFERSTNRSDGRKLVRIKQGQAPGSYATHAETSQIDPFLVDSVFLDDFVYKRIQQIGHFLPRHPARAKRRYCDKLKVLICRGDSG